MPASEGTSKTSSNFETLPISPHEFMSWEWPAYEELYADLAERPLKTENLDQWMRDWTAVTSRVNETYCRYLVGTRTDTTDKALVQQFTEFLDNVFNKAQQQDQKLKKKLVESGLKPKDFQHPWRVMQTEIKLFRDENLPLFTQEKQFQTEYDNIAGAQTVEWDGNEQTLERMDMLSYDSDRSVRERAWRLTSSRQLEDRSALNALWQKLLKLRGKIASNAGYSDYTAFRWDQLSRFDYTPQNCQQFHDAIEQAVVPAATRILEQRKDALELEKLRPWDVNVDALNRPALAPFQTSEELIAKSSAIFHNVDPQLGEYFDLMAQENLLDLDNRKGKGPGGFCISFATSQRPFIFMNSVGMQKNVRTLIHEAGHAFHAFEKFKLPYTQQRMVGSEFNEVASMAMELICSPYLQEDQGGFYSEADASRARIQHLENIILFWPYMAVVDAFQHWVYANIDEAMEPAKCDAQWDKLWQRFMPVVDWSGLEQERMTGWHRKLHLFHAPFYYVEYGLAQLGSVQIWANSIRDQKKALGQYLESLALGATVPLPKLYETAGAKFAFDADTIQKAISRIESVIANLQ